jgi:hypothetical protein
VIEMKVPFCSPIKPPHNPARIVLVWWLREIGVVWSWHGVEGVGGGMMQREELSVEDAEP